ncbi:hypoxia inducible factor 1 subunit alpha a [Colossoma macropomum]|uniref:hypoxia inducible factor 1 subunit alpha a n=1 Tax=Colossoma macropomum TaxID=42526 RepID=UPI0018643DEF|nr:hypoxia inducible factor 1 subunit alpha a [Colossoma macropomum]
MTSGAAPEKKRVSSERRKERSRDAARCRRGKETEVFYQLARELPLPHSVTSNLDKASVIRLTLSYLRLRSLLHTGALGEGCEVDSRWSVCCLKALDGILLVLSQDGDVVYVSENVSKCLGLPQIDLLGQSVFDFTHPCDHEEIREMLVHRTGLSKKGKEEHQSERRILLRMKCTLTSRGRTVNIKSATWKVLHCSGHIRAQAEVCGRADVQEGTGAHASYLVLNCEPIPHPASIESPLDSRTFLSRHTLDMRFTYCDDRVTELLGYDPKDLLQRSVYEYYHALDSDSLTKTHHNLFVKGQACTGQYRMLVKTGGFVWVETQATVIYNNKNSQPQCVVCVNYVLSGVEEPELVLSVHQSGSAVVKQEREDEEEERESEGGKQECSQKMKSKEEASSKREEQTAVLFDDLKGEPEALTQLHFSSTDTEVSVLKDVPLYSDVMLPSTSDLLSLSPLSPPTEAPCAILNHSDSTTAQLQLEDFTFPSSNTPSTAGGATRSSTQPISSLTSDLSNQCKVDVVEEMFSMETEPKTLLATQAVEDLDLEMLAPYISMDDDYQLHSHSPMQSGRVSPVPTSKSAQKDSPNQTQMLICSTGTNTKPSEQLTAAQPQQSFSRACQPDLHLSSATQPSQKPLKRKLETISLSQAIGLGSVLQVVSDLPGAGKRVRKSEVAGLEAVSQSTVPESVTILLLPSDVLNQLLAGPSEGRTLPVPLPQLTRYDCEVNAPVAGRQNLLQGEELLFALDQSI